MGSVQFPFPSCFGFFVGLAAVSSIGVVFGEAEVAVSSSSLWLVVAAVVDLVMKLFLVAVDSAIS